jgi:dolichol-phosphate mannosyltransferase
VLVCSFNEGDNLPTLFEQIRSSLPQADVLLVDDGSTDSTYEWLGKYASAYPQLTVINRGKKLGLGTAIRDGLMYAVDHDYDYCLNLDADLSHDPQQLPSILHKAISEQAALVIGSRYVAGGGFENCSWKRIFVSRMVNRLARWIVGWKVRDCSSAYRCYRTSDLKNLQLANIENASYGFLEEILWQLWKQQVKILEYPIIYTERTRGQSKISLHEAKQTMMTLLRLNRFT